MWIARNVAALLLATATFPCLGQTAFTYQGDLVNGAGAASGLYDFRFILYDLEFGGAQQGAIVCADDVQVAAGRFAVTVDPGALTPALQRWMEIAVRDGASGDCSNPAGFTTLSPRQHITPAPSSLHSATAATAANSVALNGQPPAFYRDAGNLNAGALGAALLAGTYTNPLTFNNVSNSFTGSGAGLTGLNAANIGSGILPDARLSTNVPRLNASNVFTNNNRINASLGIGTAPAYPLDVFTTGVQPARVRSDSTGGTWFDIQNDSAGGINWDLLSAGSANGEGAGSLVFRAGGGVQAARMIIKSAGNVGIGTIAPSERLHVAGNLRVDGTIAVPTTSKSLALGPGDFVPAYSGGSYNATAAALAVLDSIQQYYLAAIHLPNGALITGLTLYAEDNSNARDITFLVDRIHHTGSPFVPLVAMATSGAVAGVRIFPSPVLAETIDNSAYRYVVSVGWAVDGVNPISVRSVVVHYTVSSL